jgi:hypothetical protein
MVVGDILVTPTLRGFVMKTKHYSALLFLGIVVIGIIAFLLRQDTAPAVPITPQAVLLTPQAVPMTPQAIPFKLRTTLIGEVMDDLDAPIEAPTISEVRAAIELERKDDHSIFPGTAEKMKIESVDTLIGPPLTLPLLGDVRLRRAFFTCSVQLVHRDGSHSREVVLIEKNAFRTINSDSEKH